MLQFEDDGRKEMRLCYYMIGHRLRGRGKWLYGQFAAMIRREDFDKIMSKAREKGWITYMAPFTLKSRSSAWFTAPTGNPAASGKRLLS